MAVVKRAVAVDRTATGVFDSGTQVHPRYSLKNEGRDWQSWGQRRFWAAVETATGVFRLKTEVLHHKATKNTNISEADCGRKKAPGGGEGTLRL